jgi:uncharacterized protein
MKTWRSSRSEFISMPASCSGTLGTSSRQQATDDLRLQSEIERMTVTPPATFHVLAKPTGAICNLDCKYCFFLSKEELYPNSRFRMPDEVLASYIRQQLESQGPEATIAWQGGEPTLMGLDFFRRSIAVAHDYLRPGQSVQYTIQTNGTLIDEEWCEFLRENKFLVGLSIDGTRELHDVYRVDKRGRPTFDKVIRAARLMQQHEVDFNVLCTVHAKNVGHPLEVYHYFRDELGARFLQFIPIVERINADGRTLLQEGSTVTERSVPSEKWGRFLITIFDEWVRRDVGTVFVQMFDAALASWVGAPPAVCIFAETCGDAVALEHNGDLYSCDHFVEPKYLLGNLMDTPIAELVSSPRQRAFGNAKRDTLPRYCRECEVRFACHGECPKNRFIVTPDGEPGLNYLCAGYKAFFNHIDRPMRMMADLLRRGRFADEVMQLLATEEKQLVAAAARAGRNELCPCGSGVKTKFCHGRPAARDLQYDGRN